MIGKPPPPQDAIADPSPSACINVIHRYLELTKFYNYIPQLVKNYKQLLPHLEYFSNYIDGNSTVLVCRIACKLNL